MDYLDNIFIKYNNTSYNLYIEFFILLNFFPELYYKYY